MAGFDAYRQLVAALAAMAGLLAAMFTPDPAPARRPVAHASRSASTPRAAAVRAAAAGDAWYRLRVCESGNRYTIHNPPYGGAYQFTQPTWDSMRTGWPHPWTAPPAVQDDAARRLYARSGRGQWPVCGPKAGLR